MKELWSENSIDEGCFYKINWESRTYLKADGKGLVEVGQNRVQRENIPMAWVPQDSQQAWDLGPGEEGAPW